MGSRVWPTTWSTAATTCVVDATHPFAAQITGNAVAACARAGVPLVRLQRPGWTRHPLAGEFTWVDDVESARVAAEGLGVRPFLTTGRQQLDTFAVWDDRYVLARVVDPPDWDVPAGWEVLRARGPYPYAAERDLLESRAVDVLLTKDSGGALTEAKLGAAHDLGVPVVVVRRPPVPTGSASSRRWGSRPGHGGHGGQGGHRGGRRETSLTAYALAYVREVTADLQQRARWERLLPGVAVLRRYDRVWLRGDVLGGITVSAYLIPQVMAYAEVAGLPAITGLWAALRASRLRPARLVAAAVGGARVDDGPDDRGRRRRHRRGCGRRSIAPGDGRPACHGCRRHLRRSLGRCGSGSSQSCCPSRCSSATWPASQRS